MAPYLYKTTDYGATWTKITDGITPTEFTRAIREDLYRPGMLYAATERSMWLSYDAGAHWQNLARNLPPVPVHDIALKDDDMVIATHGRAFWVMENLTTLRQAPEVALAAGKTYFYKPAPVYRIGGAQALVTYRLGQADQVVTLEFLDGAGKLIKKFASTDTQPTPPAGRGGGGGGGRGGGGGPPVVMNRAGVNTYRWDMRYPDASNFRGMILWAGGVQGPVIAPGSYTIRLTVGSEKPVTQTLVVKLECHGRRSRRTDAARAQTARSHDGSRRRREEDPQHQGTARRPRAQDVEREGVRFAPEAAHGQRQQRRGLGIPDQEQERRRSAQLPRPAEQPDRGAARVRAERGPQAAAAGV
jgi:hypothetical protein